jgi:hypothetical protein
MSNTIEVRNKNIKKIASPKKNDFLFKQSALEFYQHFIPIKIGQLERNAVQVVS